jgi:hypothetical protein
MHLILRIFAIGESECLAKLIPYFNRKHKHVGHMVIVYFGVTRRVNTIHHQCAMIGQWSNEALFQIEAYFANQKLVEALLFSRKNSQLISDLYLCSFHVFSAVDFENQVLTCH